MGGNEKNHEPNERFIDDNILTEFAKVLNLREQDILVELFTVFDWEENRI